MNKYDKIIVDIAKLIQKNILIHERPDSVIKKIKRLARGKDYEFLLEFKKNMKVMEEFKKVNKGRLHGYDDSCLR